MVVAAGLSGCYLVNVSAHLSVQVEAIRLASGWQIGSFLWHGGIVDALVSMVKHGGGKMTCMSSCHAASRQKSKATFGAGGGRQPTGVGGGATFGGGLLINNITRLAGFAIFWLQLGNSAIAPGQMICKVSQAVPTMFASHLSSLTQHYLPHGL